MKNLSRSILLFAAAAIVDFPLSSCTVVDNSFVVRVPFEELKSGVYYLHFRKL